VTSAITMLTPTSLGGLPLRRASDMPPNFNFLVYGEPGVGKTRLCASSDAVQEMRKVLILDVDGGIRTAHQTFPNVEYLTITSWKFLQAIYNDLRADASHGFRTVVLDTATEAQKINMMGIMEKVAERATAEGKSREEELPGVREWGISGEQVRRMIRAFRDLPLNFLMTAHVKDDKDERTLVTKKSPDLPGKLSRQVSGFFDIVFYMYQREVDDKENPGQKRSVRLLTARSTERVIAKDRTDQLPSVIQNITMEYIFNTATGGNK
jgi:hypothetical protein